MLSVLQERLAEAHGLAMAAAETVERVDSRVDDAELHRRLDELRLDAAELRGRCLEAEHTYGEELARELLAHANTVAERAADLANAWFKAGTAPLAAWSFLAMGEAAEVAAWSAVTSLAERAGDERLAELGCWALPIQQRHLETALDGAAHLAGLLDPRAPRWG